MTNSHTVLLTNAPSLPVWKMLDVLECLNGTEVRLVVCPNSLQNTDPDWVANFVESTERCQALVVLWKWGSGSDHPGGISCPEKVAEMNLVTPVVPALSELVAVERELVKKLVIDSERCASVEMEEFTQDVSGTHAVAELQVPRPDREKVAATDEASDNGWYQKLSDVVTKTARDCKVFIYDLGSSASPVNVPIRMSSSMDRRSYVFGGALSDEANTEIIDSFRSDLPASPACVDGPHHDLLPELVRRIREDNSFKQLVYALGCESAQQLAEFNTNGNDDGPTIPVLTIGRSCNSYASLSGCLRNNRETAVRTLPLSMDAFATHLASCADKLDRRHYGACITACRPGMKASPSASVLKLLSSLYDRRFYLCAKPAPTDVGGIAALARYGSTVLWCHGDMPDGGEVGSFTPHHLVLRDTRSDASTYTPRRLSAQHLGQSVNRLLLVAVDDERNAVLESNMVDYCERVQLRHNDDVEAYVANLRLPGARSQWRPFLFGVTGK
ncbi:MAG: hypothetical protein U1E29_11265, partial [Coriobacteriia bacterium]|nr:hypothetical protein [Coriobacteriia bacterium]